jgi:GDP-L-fucose synthase
MTMDRIDDGEALNLSTGVYTSFKQFALMAAEAVGYSPEVVGLSDQPAGVFARGGDTTKQKELGFEARIAFSEGVRKAVESMLRQAQ